MLVSFGIYMKTDRNISPRRLNSSRDPPVTPAAFVRQEPLPKRVAARNINCFKENGS